MHKKHIFKFRGGRVSSLLVVDDHALVREGLVQALNRVPGVTSVAEAPDAESALELLELRGEFDLVLLDLMLPGISGLSLLGVLHKRYPAMRVIVVSALDGPEAMTRARAAGAVAFVCKARPAADLVDTVKAVLSGEGEDAGPELAARARAVAGNAYERYGLTAAQARVMDLLTKGKSNRDIADTLGVTEGTVKVHVTAILKALHVSSRTQALLTMARSTAALGI